MAEVDFQGKIETAIYDDLEGRIESGNWEITEGQAELYGTEAGRVGGAAACTSLGLALASPLCAQLGGVIGGWIGGAVWGALTGLFGGGSDYEARRAEYISGIVVPRANAMLEASEANAIAMRAWSDVLQRLYKLADVAGLHLQMQDIAAVVHVAGAQLEGGGAAGPYRYPADGSDEWFLSTLGVDASYWLYPFRHGGQAGPADRGRVTPSPETAKQIRDQVVARQKDFVQSLATAAKKAAIWIVAAGAAKKASEVSGIAKEANPSAGGGIAPVLLIGGALGLGVMLMRKGRA